MHTTAHTAIAGGQPKCSPTSAAAKVPPIKPSTKTATQKDLTLAILPLRLGA